MLPFDRSLAPRLRLAIAVTALCAAALAAIVSLSPPNGATAGPTVPTRHGAFYGTTLPSGPPVDFTLKDQDGHRVALSSFRGQVVAATFVYSTCASVCPNVVSQLTAAIAELPRPIPALAISVDPKQDGATNVRAFLLRQQATGSLHYLSGSRAQLQPIWRRFGVTPQRKLNSAKADFTVKLVLLDRSGRPRVSYSGLAALSDPDAIAADIRTLQAQR